MWSEIRDGIGAYETSKAFSGKVTLEECVLAVIIGIMTHSLWAGVIAFFVILVGGSCTWKDSDFLLFWFCVPSALCFGFAVLIFLGSVGAHITTVGY